MSLIVSGGDLPPDAEFAARAPSGLSFRCTRQGILMQDIFQGTHFLGLRLLSVRRHFAGFAVAITSRFPMNVTLAILRGD